MGDKLAILLLLLILSPVITYLIHILLVKLARGKPPQLTAVLSGIIGNIPILFISLMLVERITGLIYSLIVYNSLAYVYFHIFNMSETARRIHLLVDLKRNGKLKKEDILKRYSPEDIVDIRLSRLLSLRQLRLEDNLYKIDRSFLLIAARIYSFWGRLLSFNIIDLKAINSIRK